MCPRAPADGKSTPVRSMPRCAEIGCFLWPRGSLSVCVCVCVGRAAARACWRRCPVAACPALFSWRCDGHGASLLSPLACVPRAHARARFSRCARLRCGGLMASPAGPYGSKNNTSAVVCRRPSRCRLVESQAVHAALLLSMPAGNLEAGASTSCWSAASLKTSAAADEGSAPPRLIGSAQRAKAP